MAEFEQGEPVEWEAGPRVYCGAVKEQRSEDPESYLIQVYDRDEGEFRETTVIKPVGLLAEAGDLADDCCGQDGCSFDGSDGGENADNGGDSGGGGEEDSSTEDGEESVETDNTDEEETTDDGGDDESAIGGGDMPVPNEEDEDDESYTCAGNDGDCSREVEEEGGYCWQHGPDEDE